MREPMKDERVVFLEDHEIQTAGGRVVYRRGAYHQLEPALEKELKAAGVVTGAAEYEKRAAATPAGPVMHAATSRAKAPAAQAPAGKMWPATLKQDLPKPTSAATQTEAAGKAASVRRSSQTSAQKEN